MNAARSPVGQAGASSTPVASCALENVGAAAGALLLNVGAGFVSVATSGAVITDSDGPHPIISSGSGSKRNARLINHRD